MKNPDTSPSGRIVVLGMHRSGTSCIGNLLTRLGVYFGDPSISIGSGEENRKGFFERRDLREICDAILQGAGCDWWAVNEFSPDRVPPPVQAEARAKFERLVQELDRNQPWFIKEPRLCLVWPILGGQVPNAIFLHVWRDPIEVARSLATRNGFPIDFGVALWEAYVRSAHAISRGRPSVIVSYNALLKDPAGTTSRLVAELHALGVIGVSVPDDKQLRDAVDADLYRERQATPELNELIGPTQQKIVEALAQGKLDDPALRAPLSQLSRIRLDQSVGREETIIALRKDVAEAKRTHAELRKLRNSLEERDRLVAALKDQLRSADRYLNQLRARVAVLRDKAEQALSRALAEARAVGNTEVTRSHFLRQLERTPSLNVFARGIRAVPAVDEHAAPNRRALYWHYLLRHRRGDAGNLALLGASGWFDPVYYAQSGDGVSTEVDPLIHYVDRGAREGRNPSALFDSAYYLRQNRDVAESGMNPLVHFVRHGHNEGRAPRPSRALELSRAAKALIEDFTVLPTPERRTDAELSKPLPQRLVIYTAIAGGYDDLQPPAVTPPGCDFVVFSDRPLQVEGWQVRPFNYFHPDPTRSARFVKTHPHVYFPEYDHSIWIDANIGIRGDLRKLCNALTDESPVAIFNHPLRDDIYAEAQECIKRKKDDLDVIKNHVERYRAEAFPDRSGLWETNVVVRRHNEAACVALMHAWWREIETGSRRDQLSLPVVAQRLSTKITPLGFPGEDARNHPLFTLSKHPAERKAGGEGRLPAAARKRVDVGSIPIDVGVCVYNSPDETKACLESLLNGRRPQDRLIVVDDASDAPTASLLDQIVKDREGVELVRHEQNRGYTHSANAVLKNARSPWVILLNSDTVVPPRAMSKLVMCGEQFPALPVVGPLSNAAGWQTVPQLTGSDGKFLVNSLPGSLTVEDMDRLCEELSDGVVPFVPLVNGFCFAMRRSAIDQIGLFDEVNFPIGYGEEDDFCLRAGAAGFLCGLATDTYVFHSKSASFTPARRAPLVEQGGKALRMKHSTERVAAAVETMRRHPYLALVRQRIGAALRERVPQQEAI